MPKLTVKIDPSICILAATCTGIEPKLFQIGQQSYVELADASGTSHGTEYTFEADDSELKLIEEAVDSCPLKRSVCNLLFKYRPSLLAISSFMPQGMERIYTGSFQCWYECCGHNRHNEKPGNGEECDRICRAGMK